MAMSEPIRFGMTGLGSWAAELCDRFLREAESGTPHARLVAVSEPRLERYSAREELLREHGVCVVSEFDDLLKQDVECVWLPLPIDLHLPYTERALAAGKHVLCEKPAAGVVGEVDAMIAARDRSGLLCAVAFQDLYQPAVWELKRRLVQGEFGVVISGAVLACWPRSERYYQRNGWAGKLKRDGRWVLDSPANNAMAHYIHLAQFLMGASERESLSPAEVEAELYRVNPIETYDTCSMRLTFDGGSHLLVHLTHACQTTIDAQITLRTQFAQIKYLPKLYRIEIMMSGVTETIPLVEDRQTSIFDAMYRAIRKGDASRLSTLEMARAHAVAMSAATAATPVIEVPKEHVEVADDQGSPLRTIRGIERAMQQANDRGRMLHECGSATWSKPAGDVYTSGQWQFPGPYTR